MRAYYPHPLVKYDKRCKYGYLFLIMQIFIHYFAIATVDGFDFLSGVAHYKEGEAVFGHFVSLLGSSSAIGVFNTDKIGRIKIF